ncbi:hypothetical protein BJ508DRAFT_335782 [Ascobolus immersus RN42]|uniref:Uncharacterized protein n=1 Tax=Ascobolus immersus RN42 TaxID=1160509 RepID=A0A3N4HB43_ASCIM|nr:hypothetical protein BJ508DRAFT_335782 [Ascobolus immersus RN42]
MASVEQVALSLGTLNLSDTTKKSKRNRKRKSKTAGQTPPSPQPSGTTQDDVTLSPIDLFFARHSNYTHNRTALVQAEFKRLAGCYGWKPVKTDGPNMFGQKRIEFANAVLEEYEMELEGETLVQQLVFQCVELGATVEQRTKLTSKTQCKKFLKAINVNIFDVINARRSGQAIRTFSTYKDLKKYTGRRGKYRSFPKQCAKKSDVMEMLLECFAFPNGGFAKIFDKVEEEVEEEDWEIVA